MWFNITELVDSVDFLLLLLLNKDVVKSDPIRPFAVCLILEITIGSQGKVLLLLKH